MCGFCVNVKTGDNYNPIIQQKLNFGFLGTADADVYLAGSVTNNPVMVLGMCSDNGTGSFEHVVQISYCPMCGEKLREG